MSKISEAGQLQKAVTFQKLLVEELYDEKAANKEVLAAQAILEELSTRLESQLPAGVRRKDTGKRKKKEGHKVKEKITKKKEKEKKEKTEFVYTETTPPGEKKDMSRPMRDDYQPKAVESAWYQWWERRGFFHADEALGNKPGAKKFVIVIPPPNVTGSLHLGHALTNSVQDAIVRWHRMKGEVTCWVPGVDHAGIATQVVVEKKIMKEERKTRHDYGREAFVKKVWAWKEEYGARITSQLRLLGSSLDWDREVFTMDERLSAAVKEAFVRLHEDGLIYRSNRLVNWSCQLKTAISEIEVDHRELEGEEQLRVPGHDRPHTFGIITSFAYPISGEDDEIVVATTRLETMLGDTAVCIHPDDPRYKHLHGKSVVHPFDGRLLPIITDDYVDMSFGTGAVKITPAHDHNDYQIGKRHGLPFINILEEDGRINSNGGRYHGMKRFEAREQIGADLKAMRLYRGTDSNPMRLGICSRSKDIIEPFLKPQWYVDCASMAKASLEAAERDELKILPKEYKANWRRWLETPQDWCVSRQLWWGHRIPAYYATIDGEPAREDEAEDRWFVARSEEEACKKAAAKLKVDVARIRLRQDEDVLDTWFSSGLFPFSVFGWPNETPEYKAFYPGTLLETGTDILFFWVARMVMMGLQLTKKLPFEYVYLHTLVRDAHGRKMSKSLGNVIDPVDVIFGITLEGLNDAVRSGNLPPAEVEKAIEGQRNDFPDGIPECGADAMRFALCNYTGQTGDINLDVDRIVGYRNFCNKLWNATRLLLNLLGDDFRPATEYIHDKDRSLADRWILAQLNAAIVNTNKGFEAYNFSDATTSVYSFWLYQLCDVYLEIIKPIVRGGSAKEVAAARNVVYTCMDQGLKLLHPFMPFVTEELWQRLPRRRGDKTETIMLAEYPTRVAEWEDAQLLENFETFQTLVRDTRHVRAQYGLTFKQHPPTFVRATTAGALERIQPYANFIKTLTDADTVTCQRERPAGQCGVAIVSPELEVYIVLTGLIDVGKEVAKLRKHQGELQAAVDKLTAMTSAKDYAKVPDHVRQKNTEKLDNDRQQLEAVTKAIADFEGASA